MALYLVLKTGPSQGETYEISEGLTIGRRGAGVRLDDPKVSSEHAKVVQNPSGDFKLIDLGSKNGFTQNGALIKEVPLTPGVLFEIGETQFTVLETDAPRKKSAPSTSTKKEKRRWNEVLVTFLRKSLGKIENSPRQLLPMHPALVLDFLRGPQSETRWVLGYGPRSIGRTSVDLTILEEKASSVCFEIFPSDEGVQFKAIGQEVRLNGKSVSTEVLQVGDRIQILGTEIEVDFTE